VKRSVSELEAEHARLRMARVLGHNARIGQVLHHAGRAAQLNLAPQVDKGHRVLASLEVHQRILAHGTGGNVVEGLGQDWQGPQVLSLGLPSLPYAGAGGRATAPAR